MTGWHLIILLALVLLLFGAAKLPGLARSVGQSARIFKGEMKAMKTAETSPAGADAEAGSPSADSDAAAVRGLGASDLAAR
nr:twin-arginine translocase TatA/TatE family subunit [Microbacterium ulmi]